MIERLEGWEINLSKYLADVSGKPFQWGEHDCILHAANAVKAMTGIDLAGAFRGTYSNEQEAYKIVQDYFGGDIDHMVSCHVGEMRENCKLARRGDVVRITHEGNKAFGVVDDTGMRLAMVSPERGLIRIPKSRAEVFWRVG